MGGTPLLEAERLSKTFGSRTVLRDASLGIEPGEVHGLLGENGSGKSTLIKILAGYHHPDPGGRLRIGGRDVPLPLATGRPRELGLTFVHQDLGLIEGATVLENVRIGRYRHGRGYRVSWRQERRSVQESLTRFGVDVRADALISSLAPVDRALVAIVRALEQVRSSAHAVLILDEPTPYLPRDGVERLFDAVRDAAATGVGVLFVTHRIEEVRALTDSITILRNGSVVATAATASLTDEEIVEHIIGFSLDRLYPEPAGAREEEVLAVESLSGSGLRDVSLTLHRGEILGATGLLGMGWEQLPYLLFGTLPVETGTLTVTGRRQDLTRQTARRALREGIGLLPANRQRDSSLQAASVLENVTLPTLRRYFRGGALRHREERRRVQALLEDYDVRPPDPDQKFGLLSGGNQQKALLAKWLELGPRALIVHEPTQGVDIGARSQLFERMRDAAAGGMGLLVASGEYADLVHICDRVLVFRDGRVHAELGAGELTEERLAHTALGVGG